MNLFNISLKNIKNSFSNYAMYFISIVFSVFIFFSFKSIQYNSALDGLTSKPQTAIKSASIVVALFAFLFIYYSNVFFLNRRNNEIGTYSILGMRKRQIDKIFLYETLIIGIGAISLGVVLGFLFSKIMTMMLVKMMGQAVVVNMNLSFNALTQTIIVFAMIFIIISFRNILILRNKKLIDLFKKEREEVKQEKFSNLKGIVGTIMILLSYVIAKSNLIFLNLVAVPLILVIIIPGTFLFFSSAVYSILNFIKKNKGFYYKGRNLIAFSELSYKIKNNSRILATIAILIATSVTVLGFTVSLYYDIDRSIEEGYKYSYTIRQDIPLINEKIDNILKKYNQLDKVLLDKNVQFIEGNMSYTLVNKKSNIAKNTVSNVEIMKESDYRELEKYQNRDYKDLSSDDEVYYITGPFSSMMYKSITNSNIKIDGYDKEFNVVKEVQSNLVNENSTFEIVVVRDDVFNKLIKSDNTRELRIIDTNEKHSDLDMSLEMREVAESGNEFMYPMNFTSKIEAYTTSIETNGLLLFIGVFLSAVFLLCTGSIILFKQLSSIYDDKDRYILLKKLGANNKDIEKMISKQLKVVFLLPLIVGTIHNIFAMSIVQRLMPRSILVPVLITLGIYYSGYFIYYFITLKYAKTMVLSK